MRQPKRRGGLPDHPHKVITQNNPSEDSSEFMEVTDVAFERDKTQSLGGELYTLLCLSLMEYCPQDNSKHSVRGVQPPPTGLFFFFFGSY